MEEPWLVPGLGWELLPFVLCSGSGLWQWRRGEEVGQQVCVRLVGVVGTPFYRGSRGPALGWEDLLGPSRIVPKCIKF